MECRFEIGQRVVCVEEADTPNSIAVRILALFRRSRHPRAGSIYAIEHIVARAGVVWLCLRDVPHWMYPHDAFRPLDERDTDISVFTSLLDPLNQLERAREDA